MSRRLINSWMRQNGVKGQSEIRRASWRHSQLYSQDNSYRQQAQEVYSDIGTVPCTKSKQDAAHFTHFVNAMILILLKPEEVHNLKTQDKYEAPQKIITTTKDDSECTMYKEVLFSHLWGLINGKTEQKNQTKTTAGRFQELEARVRRLEQYTGLNGEGKNGI